MLYDKRWDKTETKPDAFSLASLIAWLETMPADDAYRSWDLDNCLLGQWSRSAGLNEIEVRNNSYHLGIRSPFAAIASIDGPATEPHTFGAALKRARAAL